LGDILMDEIFSPARPLKVWRAEILGTRDTPGSFKSLAEAVNAWQRAIVSLISTVEAGHSFTSEPKGLSTLSDMLATVCDVGPASIDPTPILECYNTVADIRRGATIDAQKLEDSFNRAMPVISRLLHAWIALYAGDGKEPDGPSGYNKWRHEGRETEGEMQPKLAALAGLLFEQKGRRVSYSALSAPGGIFADGLDTSIQKQGNNLSTWFFDNEVPLVVKTDRTGMAMLDRKTEE
jgi:hypothetical protein